MTGSDYPASANPSLVRNCSHDAVISIKTIESIAAKSPTARITVPENQATQINLADYFTGVRSDSNVIS